MDEQTWEQNDSGEYEDTYEQPQYENGEVENDFVEPPTWQHARRALGAYFIVVVGLMLISAFLASQQLQAQLSANPNMPQPPQALASMMLPLACVGILLNGLIGTLVLMIQYIIMHLIATRLIDGYGSYSGLIARVTVPLIAWTLFSGVVNLIFDQAVAMQLLTASRQATPGTFTTIFSNQTFVIGKLIVVLSVVPFAIWACQRVAQNYNFAWNRGCATLLAWIGVMAILAIGCYFTVFIGMFAQFSNMLQMLPTSPSLRY